MEQRMESAQFFLLFVPGISSVQLHHLPCDCTRSLDGSVGLHFSRSQSIIGSSSKEILPDLSQELFKVWKFTSPVRPLRGFTHWAINSHLTRFTRTNREPSSKHRKSIFWGREKSFWILSTPSLNLTIAFLFSLRSRSWESCWIPLGFLQN